jgi:excisionase family DNA binding protein
LTAAISLESAVSDLPPDHRPELLTIREAAEVLRAPIATLRYWRHLGTGPRSFRLGRRVLYRRDDLDAWVEGCRGQANCP